MRSTILLLAFMALLPQTVLAQAGATAFVHVNVLPMDRERVLEDHTVLVKDGIIQAVAPSYRVALPEGARVVDGDGLFLMPALADMEVSLPDSRATEEEVRDFLFLFLANNVAVLRGMDGSPNQLQVKRQIASGTLLGPTVYVGAPPMGGENAQDPEGAVELMLAHRSAGYDFQPIDGDVPQEVWVQLADEAHSVGYTFGGTIPESVGLRMALSTGVSTVDRLDGYLEEVVSDGVRTRLDRGEAVPMADMLESVEGRKTRAIAAHTRSSDSWVVPTLHLWENHYRELNVDSLLALPEMRYVSSFQKERWTLEAAGRSRVAPETARLMIDVRRRILRALALAGVGVMMGTGTPEMFNVPGFSLRQELRSMEAAGLTPYEILVTGTRSVAEYARSELLEPGNFGTVAEGNRGDLLLLRKNPFEDLEALWDREGVMVRGRWLSREDIDAELGRIAERIGRIP